MLENNLTACTNSGFLLWKKRSSGLFLFALSANSSFISWILQPNSGCLTICLTIHLLASYAKEKKVSMTLRFPRACFHTRSWEFYELPELKGGASGVRTKRTDLGSCKGAAVTTVRTGWHPVKVFKQQLWFLQNISISSQVMILNRCYLTYMLLKRMKRLEEKTGTLSFRKGHHKYELVAGRKSDSN